MPIDGASELSGAKRQLLERLTGRPSSVSAAPSSATEHALAAIWASVLEAAPAGIDDHFFRLGGDSIRALRVRTLVRDRLEVDLDSETIYEHPTIRALAAAIDARRAAASEPPAAAPDDDLYPMSEMQKAMVFHAELDTRERSYINHGVAAIAGPLSLPALAAALNDVVRRHEILRTSFDFTAHDEPMQRVHAPRRLALPIVDLQGIAGAGGDACARAVRAAAAGRSFGSADYPLLRVIACTIGPRETRLAHAHHHAILDGWSLNLLFRELWDRYETIRGGRPSMRPGLRTRVADFVRAERAVLRDGASREFWRQTLDGVTRSRFPVIAARLRQRPDADTHTGSAALASAAPSGPARSAAASAREPVETRGVTTTLSPELSRALTELAGEEEVHVSTVLLTAHAAAMAVLHGQDSIITGRVVNARPDAADGDAVLGLFVNTCLHVADVRGRTWRALLRQTAARERAAHPHRRYPIAKVSELLGPGAPVETLFVFEHYHMHAAGPLAPGLRIGGRDVAANDMKLAASFVWSPDRSRIELTLYGRAGHTPPSLLRRAQAWYLRALEALAGDPERRVRLDELVTAAAVHQQTIEWNDTAAIEPGLTLHASFEAQVRRAPAALALASLDETFTYDELNREANRVAHLLRRGLGDGDAPIALLLEPGADQVIAVLAAAKAGYPYLPLDTAYPPERLRAALAAGGVRAVVSTSDVWARAGLDGTRAVLLDRVDALLDDQPDTDPALPIAGDRPLMVMFTSGSTGTPKAIRLNHRGRANNFHDFITRFRIGAGDRVLAASNLTFDMSAFDILGTLAAGAAIVAPAAAEKKDPRAWRRLIARHRVTIWHSAPALARMLLDAGEAASSGDLTTLRLALLGGDWIPPALPARLAEAAPGIDVISLGGATEVSMDSTWHRIPGLSGDPGFAIPTVPYGRPMANQTAYLLGPQMQPAPIGTPAELHLGGVGVADGYVGRPELTAARFVPNPYPSRKGERIYRTGDQARHLSDGTLELLGRRDFQIKINGLRIEPAEIEKALVACAGVERAVVAARAGGAGQPRLVAYIVPERTHGGDRDALIASLRTRLDALPAMLRPAAYVCLDALPLTAHGKVNRLALPEPARDAVTRRAAVAPRHESESLVLEAWRAVLRDPELGVEDDFFESGGDSVSATQIVSRLRAAFRIDLPLSLIFDHPTVAGQARQIRGLHA